MNAQLPPLSPAAGRVLIVCAAGLWSLSCGALVLLGPACRYLPVGTSPDQRATDAP